MKKIVLIMCVAFWATIQAVAQQKGYEFYIDGRIAPDINNSETFFGFSTTQGYRFNQHIFLGGGIGLDFASYDSNTRIIFGNTYKEIQNEFQVIIPIYVAFKANFTKTRVSPFFLFKSGYVFGNNDFNRVQTSGVFFEPSVGLDFNLGAQRKYAVLLDFGLNICENKNLFTWDLEQKPRTKIVMNVGFRF